MVELISALIFLGIFILVCIIISIWSRRSAFNANDINFDELNNGIPEMIDTETNENKQSEKPTEED